MPLLNKLSQSSLDSFESDGKVEQIQGRLAQFAQKWRFQFFFRVLKLQPNRSKRHKNLKAPLLNELSQSSLDSFELDGKVGQIQGRSA